MISEQRDNQEPVAPRQVWRRVELIAFPVLALALAAQLYFSVAPVRDPDGLWHLRHAAVCRDGLLRRNARHEP